MNQKLQNILDIIQQSEKLDVEQKNSLIKAVKDADKELEITAFKLERTEKVKKTTAILLEETIEELEQKRKAVEVQNRELEIEAALEKVRAVAMSMNKPDDLLNICEVLYKEFNSLGFAELRNAMINIHDDEKKSFLNYDYSDEIGKSVTLLNYNSHPVMEKQIKQSRMANDAFSEAVYKDKDLEAWKEFRRNYGEKDDPRINNISALYYYFYSIGTGSIGISTFNPIGEEKLSLLKRFRNVFSLSYQRYLDIALAEAQAREAQIELALERVRARTMAMHISSELREVAVLIFEQLKHLGIESFSSGFNIWNNDYKNLISWMSNATGQVNPPFEMPIQDYEQHKRIYASWKNQESFMEDDMKGNALTKHYNFLRSFPLLDESFKIAEEAGIKIPDRQVHNIAFFSNGYLLFITLQPQPHFHTIFQRLANVFDQTYTRFLDLQKAEAQARESEIQLALERVRARTMAMHHSTELGDVAAVLFTQMNQLVTNLWTCGFVLCEKDRDEDEWWLSMNAGFTRGFFLPNVGDFTHATLYKGWLNGDTFLTVQLEGEALKEHYAWLMGIPISRKIFEEMDSAGLERPDWQKLHAAYFSKGYLCIITQVPCPEEEIFKRFAQVFDLTYTRFLDLQKAEAQAREAQIEASLEKVRSSAMAMHNSNDISSTTTVIFEELKKLNIKSKRCGIALLSGNSFIGHVYAAATSSDGKFLTLRRSIDMTQHQSLQQQYESWKKQENYFIEMNGDELKSYYQLPFFYSSPDYVPPANYERTEYGYYISFSEGLFYAWTDSPYSEIEINILNRFKSIIELTFRRFFDLQKAEAQAREAQIEASLERVRAHAMAMHNSADVSSTVNIFFKELKTLGITPMRCGVGEMLEETRTSDLVFTTADKQGELYELPGKLKHEGHPVVENIYNYWKRQEEYHPVLQGADINAYYRVIKSQMTLPDFPDYTIHFGNYFYFKEGFFFAWAEREFTEEAMNIFRKFTSVLSLTYKRYKDLKQAEANAREAVKQASLDRVRAEIASMRSTEDLNRITPIIWRELKTLDVPFIRCGVFIVDEEKEKVQVYLSTPDGKSLGVLNLSFDENKLTSDTVEHWRKKKIFKVHWNKDEFINWTKSMIEIGQVQNAETYQGSAEPPESLDLHFVPFTQGMLYVGNTVPLTEAALELVKTLAEAFSIAYARYEDFKNLEEAKNKIEVTLKELKSAQAQLIHSEKMASLGELTAGIAHEIKNPLNFVNNFSEISGELINEIKEELDKNDKDEVLAILNDLKQNLEKINQHGKRADSIVKGMLLHSRRSSGEKTLTDINDLLEQYVTLAYHGLKALDKEFNITIEKKYDKTLDKIDVIPQDISRVFLNIINNACYAAYDKKKKGENNFSPTLKVSTKNLKDKVEIRIGDNGNGIPADILDKIFQPFFTTKPTGEGTGLGLSLSYDIVTKVHGGELKVETKEGEGSEFIIQIPFSS